MIGPLAGVVGTVPRPPDFALLHEGTMPQKDQLCGAFWASLTLSAADRPAGQEKITLRAGTTLAEGNPAGWLSSGAGLRTDYEATIPVASDGASAGTSATGVARSIEELSGGTLAVVPVAGPWSAGTVVSLVEIAAAQTPGCVMIANLRTGYLWGSRPPARLLLDYLHGRQVEAPPPGSGSPDGSKGPYRNLYSSTFNPARRPILRGRIWPSRSGLWPAARVRSWPRTFSLRSRGVPLVSRPGR